MERIKIFFSWANEHQSTKQFILNILNTVKQDIIPDGIDIEIQESTSNTLGFVKIEDVILERIENCDFFVADLTPTNVSSKSTVNSNVCFELGYMIGRHGLDRVFGLCNSKYIKNPATDLPFDFSHNRVMRINVGGTNIEKEHNLNLYASDIKKGILDHKNNGNLHSVHPLKLHDKEINARICTDLENYKKMILGFVDHLECYCLSEYDYLADLLDFLLKSTNRFFDSSLEQLRNKLTKAICDFLNYQACHTHSYFDNPQMKCTKLYLIEEHPERCDEYFLPNILDLDHDKYEEKMEPYRIEFEEYRNRALHIITCYEELEKRYVFLVN